MKIRCGVISLWTLLVATTLCAAEPAAAPGDRAPQLRYPVALAFSHDERFLYTANRCGSVSVVDIAAQQTIAEIDIGQQLSDLKRVDANRYLLTDEAAHELILVTINGSEIRVAARAGLSAYPVSISYDADRRVAYVASLWSRRLTSVLVGENDTLTCDKVLDLEIAPRAQVLAPDQNHLIVGDSFRGELAIIDVNAWQLHSTRTFPGHNIRGLTCSPNAQMLVVAHQMLNDLARTERNDVHWGLLMSNDLRWLRLSTLLSDEDLYEGAHMHPLGEAGNATADPAGVAIAANGTTIVTLAGVGEVAIGKEHDFSLYRVMVGKRPTAVITSSDCRRAYVANTFGDSISFIDLAERTAFVEVSLGPQPELTLAERGERLFYDASLSHDNWMSCHSCHTDGHSNGGLTDNFSDGSFGDSKRVLSLLGVIDTLPLAWNGSVSDLATQLNNSVQHTMQRDSRLNDAQSAALVAYLATLVPPPSVDVLRQQLDAPAIDRGQQIFAREGCIACHEPPLYTTADTYDVGLVDELGNREFNPPSLRAVSQRGPYFHDNRAGTLQDVLRTHQHQLAEPLSDGDLNDLIAFLRSL